MKLNAAVDRFEGSVAVLVVRGEQIPFPRTLLPKSVKAGDVLALDVRRDVEGTKRLRRDTKRLQDELRDKDDGCDDVNLS